MECSEDSFLKLDEAYHYGCEMARVIKAQIEGRAIFFPHEAGVLAQVIYDGRHSDHVEIGTLYGASAILVALVKEKFKMHGRVYCIDPLEMRKGMIEDIGSVLPMSADLVMSNAEYFGVAHRLELCLKYSSPWPLGDRTFGTGYIDGDHWNGQPMRDWLNMKKHVSYAIVFDDYCHNKPEVVSAVMAAINDPDWSIIHIAGTMAYMRKRQ